MLRVDRVLLAASVPVTAILTKEMQQHKQYVCAAASLLIIAICLSRLYLGVHYPTDIIAGYGIGFIWLITCMKVRF